MAYSLIEIASNNAQKAPSAMSMAVLGRSYNANAVEPTETESYNNGGFLGGVGYLGEKLAVGFMSSIEGIWDYAAGGLAKLFGADDWAEQQFANDWFGDWYSHPEEWYNPSDGWRTAGDIAGGIGTSLPSILASIGAVAIAVGTAGAGTPISAGILSAIGGGTAAVTAGLGAAGTATKQAYKETGQLTGKEFGYGALSGVTEGALEGVTTALSLGTGQIVKSVAGSFAKETVKSVAKQSVVKTLAKGFIGEAFEEGMAEVLDPVWQRLTYNPNAKNATPQEVAYAAFVGGMSGMLMGGAGAVYSSGNSFLKGNNLVGRGLDAEVVGLSQQLAAFETANNTGDETFQTIAQTYADLTQSLETTGGKVTTVTQKKLLGDLHRANTVAVFKPMIARSAANIVNNAELIAQRLNEYGYKTTDGKPVTFTADQLRAGVDVNNPSSFSEALKTNSILRELAVADTTGHLVMDTARFEQATLMGKRLASQVDLNRFIETATPSEINAVSQALGIENWATLDVDTFNQKITSFVESGGVQQYADRRATVQTIQAIPAETARPMPKMVNLRQDGSVRYSDGSTQIAITRQGDAYTVYDYASGHLSKNMTRSEVNKLLRDYNTQQADILAGARAQMEAESELRRQAEEIDTYARENIADYTKLSAPNQSMIRKVIREGRAKGMTDEDVLTYAKISAHAGIDIAFDKQATFRGHDEEGNEKYADGFYDPKTNRIVVNPDSKRTHERLLIHELDHAIRQFLGTDGVRHAKVFRQALEGVSPEVAQRITQAYSGVDSSVSQAELVADETNAYFAEEVLSNRHTLEKLIEAEPSLKDKILSFFKGASEDYKSVPKFSKAARSYYKTYKKLFDEFAERNFQNNATEAQTARLSGEVSDARFSLQFADHIADNQRRFILSNNVALTQDELELAIDQTAHMVEVMSRYKDILPADTVPKKAKATLVKNGSYDISVENTTICVRTLAYNSFVEMVSEKIGRPLTQMESFLVSQKLYDIAKEPQCLYCYVSLDRKAYNDMVLKYIDQRERAIEAYERAGRPDITSESHPLYQEYLAGRKATKPQWKRYTSWIEAYRNGDSFLSREDVATESRRAELARTGSPSQKAQLKDLTDYAQNASQAKKQTDYVAYYDDILRLSAPVVRNLNKHYGLRWYSFSDYSGAFIVENMQQITDASIRGLKGLAYTKDADFVRIFAPTGMNINVSVFVKENADGTFSIDPKQSANATAEELISLRESYPNVGVVATATSDAGVEWALAQGWTDVVIPFHIVRTGSNVADFYKWKNFTFEQSDTVADQSLWDAYVDSVASGTSASARKKVSKMIYPSEHQNNRETYLRLIEERGLKPRFSSFLDNPNYMKLVNETRQSEAETVALKPVFDVDAAEAAFQKFVDKGGYYEGWYNDGIDVESEAETVAQDVLAGKKANEVSYGRQDIDAEGIQRGRKSNREHGRRFALPLDEASGENYRNLVKEINDENNLGTEERNLSAEDIERLERIFDSDIVTDAEDRKLYARALKLIGGYSEVTLEDGSESLTVKVVDPKYYTKEMLRTERANNHAEYQTRFFVDSMTFADGEEYNVMGLADTDERIAYAKITEREAPLRKIMHGFSEEVAHFTEEESSVSAISRHERLHLLLRDWIFTDARAVLDAADDLRQLIDAEDGRYAKTFEKVNYWYQRKLHQNGYSFSDYSQEIACDLYSGALVMNDSKIQEMVERHIKEIDAAIEGSKVDGVRYALDVDSEGTQLTEAQQEFFRDSKVRDSKGRLLVVYHGTPDGKFYEFSYDKAGMVGGSQHGYGFYFSDSESDAKLYTQGTGTIIRAHLNITNPIDATAKDLSSDVGAIFDRLPMYAKSNLREQYGDLETAKRQFAKWDNGTMLSILCRDTEMHPEVFNTVLLNLGYDGIVYAEDGYATEYVAFKSSQAKATTNKSPTPNPDIRYALSETRGSIMTEVDPEYKPTIQDKAFSGWTAIQIAFTNAQAGIETVGRKYGVRNIESLVQSARSGRNQAEEMIVGNQYRIGADTKTYQGEGLEQIFRPIARQGEEVKGDFFDYLFNYHNMSRMTLEQRSMAEQQTRLDDIKKKVSALKKLNKRIEKLQEQIKALGRSKKDMETKRGLREELAKAKAEAKTLKKEATELEKATKAFVPLENKAVLGTTDEHGIETVVTAEQSEAIVKKYEEAHPEFKRVAEKVWAFLQNLNQYRVDTGLISQDTFDYLAKLYPHYVPTYRTGATKGIGAIEGKYNLKVKTTIKTAKGSTKNLLPPDVMIARQVMETVRAGRINQLANALYEGAEKSGDTTYIEIVSKERMTDEAIAELDPTELRPKNNEVVFFRNGERITMRVSKEIFAGFNAFNPEVEIHNPLVNGARAINNGFKRLVTSLNPAFLLRNTIRDVQDAGINTRYGKTFLKNYARASYEISHNGKLWQLYKAMGGFSSSVFDFEKGFSGMQNKWGLTKAEGNLLRQTLQGVENANAFVEQLPRLAEFISSIEAGNSAEQAILDSADVTTNFGRMGNITKVLNRTLIPFLNPSIQGCSKMIRNITSIRSAREFASLAFKAALVGVAPMVLNMLMYEDDEDYKNLRDTDKENNFLFKVGDTFVKIPRGRVASVIGGLVNRGKSTLEGEDADWAGYVKNIMQQVTPVDSMSRTIFSPFSDVANNLTWYGSAIEGRQFENTAPKDRYDENTSSIAIAIGRLINYSPKKIHYLLDQYSGVIGDFILPATTAKAEKDFLSGNFTLDPATSNKLSTEFYEMYDQAQYAKTAGDDTAAYQVRYLNKVKSAISDMYKQKSEIQNNPDLSNAEKLQQTRVVQLLINEAYKTALQDFELYTKAIEATAGMEDENLRFTEATRLMYGAERALSEYNDDVYAKCQMLNKAGVDYETLYSYYFTVRGITSDKDAQGNTVGGSKRKKVVASIKSMKITADQKLLLICASGYALQDNDLPRMSAVNAKKRLLRYILNLKGATQTEKTELAEMCGFEVKNGRVVTKSVFSIG